MTDFILSPDATQDIEETFEFIAKDNPAAAAQFLERLYDTLQLLAENPGLGRLREEFFPSLRSFVKNKHIIFYKQSAEGIDVLRVLHHSRDINTLMHKQALKEQVSDDASDALDD
ncbi:type II toxin-antitoxin system RelE/ParE family toxin [Iningainema tapete]|uniref:Toxin n=1 Tax=Iningainema tapete BLCC-T55 TaxID=2748662 RepID=A0A8J6XM98_9CYAN|nr:type II toxin-antitoxin system RelE/ParE family toxin [Iningainema tapete]MBD2775737.1 type II toxin-antitoxin system RelE/ParE family toxin [Iningainema tapete BLCC-T55]